jgi:methyl-accepting chemotaxis protein
MISLNLMLKSLFGALCLAIMAFLAVNSWGSWRKMETTKETRLATLASSKMFISLANLRTDQNFTGALLLKDEVTTSLPTALANARNDEMAAFTKAIEILGQIDFADKPTALGYFEQSLNQLKDLQQKSDAAMATPKASRPADLKVSFDKLTNDIMAHLQSTGAIIKKSVMLRDPLVDQFIHLHDLSWSLRVNSGLALSNITNNIIVRGDIPADAKQIQANFFGKLDFLRDTIKSQMANLPANDNLDKGMAAVESLYFDPQFRTLQIASLNALMAGEKLNFTRAQWDNDNAVKVNAIRDLAVAFIDEASKNADEQYRNAAYALILSLIFLVVAAVAAAAVLTTISLRVITPLTRMTSSMHSLSEGALDTPIPSLGRGDEIGAMAKAVQVFRDGARRNIELEQEAKASRLQAESEKAQTQARAEAEANERLNRATGALAAGLKRLARGDMLCEISEPFAAQFEPLREDFNNSVSQLREVLIAVGQSAGSVSSGSGEISDASDNLSKRTEQQAASIEETAAALEEITVNVQSNTERTMEVRDFVTEARTKASHASVVVSDAVAAMDRIERSAHQINQNIGVIDEIAFQTNLLALNAGVEAARAGDAGKGFAVVAQEVRELAQRSANAAKEIKALIHSSETAVVEGVRLVNSTGEELGFIAELVQRIDTHVGQIAIASQQQSVGIREVNIAINHMDQSTQSNAAMVEEMNAATAGLANEAVQLRELLMGFQTKAQSHNQGQGVQSTFRRAMSA